MRIIVTGAAGFIGYHVAERLLARGDEVVGIDNVNDYYDPRLKEARLARLNRHEAFRFWRRDLADRAAAGEAFGDASPACVVHLAAQAGVRYSLLNPHAYAESNITGFLNVLEACRERGVRHLVYASSSSVYGLGQELPYSTDARVDHPVSLYAATKKSNELMAHVYSHLFGIPTTGLRFFTVYGPWGRPDMALFRFVRAILREEPIDVYNHGDMRRDFTYIDDIVEGVVRVLDQPPDRAASPPHGDERPKPSDAPYRLFNIGYGRSIELTRFIELIENQLGKKAQRRLLPLQLGDVVETCADVGPLKRAVGFQPQTPVEVGIPAFVEWYREYYQT